MPVYSSDQFRDHVATEKTPEWSLKGAMESETGQLPLFVQTKDLDSLVSPINGDRNEIQDGGEWRDETDEEVWDRKRIEASDDYFGDYGPDGVSLRRDIAERGMEKPIRVAGAPSWSKKKGIPFPTGTILNGNHRYAVMKADHPDSWMPVHWDTGPTVGGSRGD